MFLNNRRAHVLTVVATLLTFFGSAALADIVQVQIDGIDGGSMKVRETKGAIDVLAWSWGTSLPSSSYVGAGASRTSGTPASQALTFVHNIDKATPQILRKLFEGRPIPRARLLVMRPAPTPAPYLIIEMEDVIIGSIETAGGDTQDQATETVSLGFAKVKLTYYTIDAKTGDSRPEPSTAWDYETQRSY